MSLGLCSRSGSAVPPTTILLEQQKQPQHKQQPTHTPARCGGGNGNGGVGEVADACSYPSVNIPHSVSMPPPSSLYHSSLPLAHLHQQLDAAAAAPAAAFHLSSNSFSTTPSSSASSTTSTYSLPCPIPPRTSSLISSFPTETQILADVAEDHSREDVLYMLRAPLWPKTTRNLARFMAKFVNLCRGGHVHGAVPVGVSGKAFCCVAEREFAEFIEMVLTTTDVSRCIAIQSLYFVFMICAERISSHSIEYAHIESSDKLDFVVSILLANKVLDDHTFTNRTWSDLSRLDIEIINKSESIFLAKLNYNVIMRRSLFRMWMEDTHKAYRCMVEGKIPPLFTLPAVRKRYMAKPHLPCLFAAVQGVPMFQPYSPGCADGVFACGVGSVLQGLREGHVAVAAEVGERELQGVFRRVQQQQQQQQFNLQMQQQQQQQRVFEQMQIQQQQREREWRERERERDLVFGRQVNYDQQIRENDMLVEQLMQERRQRQQDGLAELQLEQQQQQQQKQKQQQQQQQQQKMPTPTPIDIATAILEPLPSFPLQHRRHSFDVSFVDHLPVDRPHHLSMPIPPHPFYDDALFDHKLSPSTLSTLSTPGYTPLSVPSGTPPPPPPPPIVSKGELQRVFGKRSSSLVEVEKKRAAGQVGRGGSGGRRSVDDGERGLGLSNSGLEKDMAGFGVGGRDEGGLNGMLGLKPPVYPVGGKRGGDWFGVRYGQMYQQQQQQQQTRQHVVVDDGMAALARDELDRAMIGLEHLVASSDDGGVMLGDGVKEGVVRSVASHGGHRYIEGTSLYATPCLDQIGEMGHFGVDGLLDVSLFGHGVGGGGVGGVGDGLGASFDEGVMGSVFGEGLHFPIQIPSNL
ncbi:hypothetical protein HDU97_002375 [Phlyctochytrium planicorne]|nr:hypothetical protein HDU97_002375 [Phlyctochytrium planicorne]